MLLIDNQGSYNPYQNLALEEYLLREYVREEPLFLFYVNTPSVIVGRNQNIYSEVNLRYTAVHDIYVLRRLSGGGTVYHDLGNLNYSVICPDQTHLHDFAYFTSFVTAALRAFGLETELRNRSSLFIGSRKISGSAQYATRGRLLHHGTLLYDVNTAVLQQAITPPPAAIETRAVPSVRSKVVNLKELLGDVSLADLQQAIIVELEKGGALAHRQLDERAWARIAALQAERYRDWAWTYGRSPRFTIRRQIAGVPGELSCDLTVERGRITRIEWHGKRAAAPLLQRVSAALAGARYDTAAMRGAAGRLLSEEDEPDGAAILTALLP